MPAGRKPIRTLEYIRRQRAIGPRRCGLGRSVVGTARIGADLASPAGFALRTGKPVISNHLGNEERFGRPRSCAARHPPGDERHPAGDGGRSVLEVDSRSEDEFIENDLPSCRDGESSRHGDRARPPRAAASGGARAPGGLLKEMSHR